MVADRFEKVSLTTHLVYDSSLTYDQIAKAVDEETVQRDLVPAFVKLLKDTEAEVRTAIAGQIPGKYPPRFCDVLSNCAKVFVDCWTGRPYSMRS